ncbi:MAG: TrkH family potassium uptake protein [Candidatus Aminicenantes bacterium]|nr:TrkH family potassium uptake protein [Candidatus Aminicenantes bacterium]
MLKTLNTSSVFHILGYLIFMLGLMLFLPLIISYLYSDNSSFGIMISILVSFIAGGLIIKFTKKGQELSIRDGFLVVGLGWFFIALFGALPFFFSGAIPSFTDAFFESMSGFTTTGASILTNIEAMPKGLLFWRAFTHWIGGMGIIVLSLAILPMLGIGGMQLFKAEVPGPTADKLTPRVKNTAKILWIVYFGITAAEVIFLMFGGMDLFDATCHSFATMATGGFSTKNASIADFNSAYIDYVISIFMFIAGVNFALHYKFLIGKFNSYWEDAEFKTYLFLIMGITLIITFSNYFSGLFQSIIESFRYGLFQSISIGTTTGFGTHDYETWTSLSQILIFILMFIGGSAGSTGGGMKVIRLIVVIKQGFIELKKLLHPNAIIPLKVGKRVIPRDVTYSIIGFFLLYVLLFVLVAASMTVLGLDIVTAAGTSAACLGNIGPGLGNVGPTDNYAFIPGIGKWILSISMMIGRLELYTVLVIFTGGFWRKR